MLYSPRAMDTRMDTWFLFRRLQGITHTLPALPAARRHRSLAVSDDRHRARFVAPADDHVRGARREVREIPRLEHALLPIDVRQRPDRTSRSYCTLSR